MRSKFIDREAELEYLNSEYKVNRSSLVIIYGRRRIGKTSLIKKFIENKLSLYFLASEEFEKENISNLKNLVADFTENPILKKGSDFTWEVIFTVFKNYKKDQRKILVIDEFQYLGKINKAFPSIFQKIWDEKLKSENIMIILCGSLINMMESQTLSYSSPLYGRRTGQIKMKQIDYLDYRSFFTDKNEKEIIQFYSVTGGVPRYIEEFENIDGIYDGIRNRILNKRSFLYEEPNFLLNKEVAEIGSYFSVIKSIAQGNHKLSNISAALGVAQTSLTKYLSTLINLDLIERQVPVTETNPEKSKKGLYYIKDNFIEFWFKFVYPYRNYLEMDDYDYVMNKLKKNFIDNHVSFIFEKACIEKMWKLNRDRKLAFRFSKLGRWWSNSEEIDIVGTDEESEDIVFCECKYLNRKVDISVFFDLKQKAKNVIWHNTGRKEHFVIFGISGFTNELIGLANERKDLTLIN